MATTKRINTSSTATMALVFAAAFALSTPLAAVDEQSQRHSYQKGQAIDFLFLNQKPDTEQALKDYFGAVFPIVKEAGYTPLPGFRITQSPTQGNYHPAVLVIASWRSPESRAHAMRTIEERVPDFHQQRRDIWSSFDMTVYTMQEDVAFTVRSDKVYTLTAYWQEPGSRFAGFKREWLRKTRQAGGSIQLELEDGVSPFGYRYDPDYMVITEWERLTDFEQFTKENLAMDHEPIRHVNQFILDLVPRKKP
ncbi:MAG: hypothetical protein AAF560_19515 [Acidobacteriota bacterium]